MDSNGPVVSFGPYELQCLTGELRKHGSQVKLQRAPLHILTALLHQPGRVVTRDQLRSSVWPANNFGDFESGLNTAMNRLRAALGDSAESPIYIETLARVGYRFVAPVTVSPPAEVPRCVSGSGNNTGLAGLRKSIKWVAISLAAIAVIILLLFETRSTPHVTFRQVTFARGVIHNARFAEGAKQILYDDAVNGRPSRLFLTNTLNPAAAEPADLGFEGAHLAAVSARGDVAFSFHSKDTGDMEIQTVPLHGHVSQKMSPHTDTVDWSPTGTPALLTWKDGQYSIEFPPGRVLYSSRAWLNGLRVSPSGEQVAFVEHPYPRDDAGRVMSVSANGKARILSAGWGSVDGLAWSPHGREVWFTAAQSGVDRSLMAVDLDGRTRQVAQIPGGMMLRDVSPSGDALIVRATSRMKMLHGDAEGGVSRDISWLDWSSAAAVSADGKHVLFDESGQGGGSRYSVYLYDFAARSAARLEDGRALDLSNDGDWALTQNAGDLTKVTLVSIRDRKSLPVVNGGLEYRWAKFIQVGACPEILFWGSRGGGKPRLYRQRIPNGAPVAMDVPAVLTYPIVVDRSGRFVAGFVNQSDIAVLDLKSSTLRQSKNLQFTVPVAFADDGRLLTARQEAGSVVFEYLDVDTGTRQPYRRLDSVADAETSEAAPFFFARNLRTFVYSRMASTSSLFLVSGWY